MPPQTYEFLFEKTPPKPGQLEFYAFEMMGTEILRDPEGTVITRDEDLKEGDKVYAFGLFGELIPGVVKGTKFGDRYFASKSFLGSLKYGGDARECWICSGLGNRKALARISFAQLD
jgi:hypothetical protein